jgi:hypothetical protein
VWACPPAVCLTATRCAAPHPWGRQAARRSPAPGPAAVAQRPREGGLNGLHRYQRVRPPVHLLSCRFRTRCLQGAGAHLQARTCNQSALFSHLGLVFFVLTRLADGGACSYTYIGS